MDIKNSVKWIIRAAGYNIRKDIRKDKNKTIIDNESHGFVFPEATYSPWLSDTEFVKVYDSIRKDTLIDIYRCYEIWELVEESMKNKGSLIEVGVWRGGSAGLIAKRTAQLDKTRTVYACDTFEGVVKASDKDTFYKGGEHSDTSKHHVENLLYNKLGLKNVKLIEGIFPDVVKDKMNNEVFTFCHIDVDVYQSAKEIVNWIWEKLVIGGIILYDDYGFEGCEGITKFVNEERLLSDRIIIHNLNGHAIIIKMR